MVTRHYCVFGLPFTVTADDLEVGTVVDHRLRAWRTTPGQDTDLPLGFTAEGAAKDTDLPLGFTAEGAAKDTDLRLEFTAEGPASAADLCRTGEHRPVYDTPDGQVVFWPSVDAVDADFGEVRMRGDIRSGIVKISSPAFGDRDRYLATHPLTMIALTELLRRRGLYPVHAGCVALEARGVLIAGPSGSGKSTLTLALVQAGFEFLSDDLVFLTDAAESSADVLGFPDAIGVTADTVARFGELSPLRDQPPANGWRKHMIRIEDHFSATVVPSCTPVAIVFPELGPGESRLERLDSSEGWLRLVPDVLLTEPTAVRGHLRSLASLSERVICYRLRSGPDLGKSVALIAELLGCAR